MRQVVVTRYGGPSVLLVVEGEDPWPRPGEVRIEVAAAGVNYADVVGRAGCYPDAPRPPYVPGYEVSGVVTAAGEGVMSLRPGDRVAAMTMFGGYASVVTAPADRAILIPEGVGFDAAAAVPVTYLTAWMLLVGLGRCRPGDAIYVESAAGGVGLACLDLAKALGLEVVAQASAGKHGVLRERGVRHVLAPDGPRLAEQVRAAAGGRGVDVAVLSRGGRHWGRMLPALAPGGRLAVIGTRIGGRRPWSALALAGEALGAPWLDLHPFALMRANRGVFGVNLHRLATEAPELVRRGADAVTAYWGEGMLRPEVDSRFAFEDAGRAHERLTSRANVGKVLLTP